MKKGIISLAIVILTLLSSHALAAQTSPIVGRVVNSHDTAISYATVVLSQDNEQVAGAATDDDGSFLFDVTLGEYEISISYVGYKSFVGIVEAGEDLGVIHLEAESTGIDEVVVTSNFIRREADRFVVDIANAPSSIGQDGEELLKSSPGVWISDDEISINGNSNPKVYVNDRELKMSSEQLMLYLRNLKSEDVRRIEVIPLSGADFDASTSSGAIMIYLKRELNSGVMGNISLRSAFSDEIANYAPSASINYQSNRLTLYTSAWYNYNSYKSSEDSQSIYSESGNSLSEISTSDNLNRSGGGRIEAIYQINTRHSIGAEVNYLSKSDESLSKSNSEVVVGDLSSFSNSLFDSNNSGDNLSATFNYIYKLDSLGSTLKLLADYNRNRSDGFSDNTITTYGLDSLHQSLSTADFKVSTVTLAAEKIVMPTLVLKGGVKLTNNDMDSRSSYSYLLNENWVDLVDYNNDEIYSENIGAGYIIGSSRIGQWSVVAGLRGEYTQTTGRDNILNKNYMSWFPNLNVSYLLDPTGSNSITLQYSRSISRPNFWSLNPTRQQTSEYFYVIGNPSLMPEYKNSINLTYVYKYKYSLTASMQIAENSIVRVMMQDENDPNMTYYTSTNLSSQKSYFLVANLPFQITQWWSLNANVIYGYREEIITDDSESQSQNMVFANMQSTITLPSNFYLTLSYFGMSGAMSGNIEVSARHMASVSLSKSLFENRFKASISAHNLFSKDQTLTSSATGVEQVLVSRNGWITPRVGFSLSYNFKAGKEHQQRQGVESASAEDRARLTSENQNGE